METCDGQASKAIRYTVRSCTGSVVVNQVPRRTVARKLPENHAGMTQCESVNPFISAFGYMPLRYRFKVTVPRVRFSPGIERRIERRVRSRSLRVV